MSFVLNFFFSGSGPRARGRFHVHGHTVSITSIN